jgi:hypothetical protein
VYAVRTPGALEAERSGGRLRMRLPPLPCRGAGNLAGPREQQGPKAVKETKEGEEEYGFSKYVRGGRCVEPEDGAAGRGTWSCTCTSSRAYSRTQTVTLLTFSRNLYDG